MSRQTVIAITSLSQIDAAAKTFLELCRNRFFFAFYGELGAGKTTFIKAVCKELGCTDTISSPTYSIVNEYRIPSEEAGSTPVIYHMDFYRIKNLDEALNLGAEEYFYSKNSYCFVEWPERIEEILPKEAVKVWLSKTNEQSRNLIIEL